MPPYRGPQRAVRSRRQRQVDARTRRVMLGPTTAVANAGRSAAKVQRKAARPTGVFARPLAKQSPRQAHDPVGAKRASRNRAAQARRQAVKSQRPVLPAFPVLKSYTPKQEATIRAARVTTAKRAVQGGVPITDVGRYLTQTHDARTLEPYLRAERQYRQRFERNTAVLRQGGKVGEARALKAPTTGARALQVATFLPRKAFISPRMRFLNQLGAVTSPNGVGGRVLVNTVKDAVNLPGTAVASAYYTGAAGVEALLGHPARAKQLAKNVWEGDPVVLALRGKPGPALKAAEQHPLATALELYGGKAGVGRSAGRVVPRPSRAARTLEGTSLTEPRVYSRDVFTRTRQRASDQRQVRKATKLERQAKQDFAAGNLDRGQQRLQQATLRTRVSNDELRRRVDETVAATEDLRRPRRSQAIAAVKRTQIPDRKGGHVVSLVAQRIVKPTRQDLRAYRDELAAQHAGLEKPQARANVRLRKEIDRALKSRKLDLPRVAKAADEYAAATLPQQDRLGKAGMLAESQAEKARLIPYAVRNMGARHDPELGIVDRSGAPLATDAIRAHMRANGVGEPGFVSQAPNSRGARNFYQTFFPRPQGPSGVRTGEATRRGTFDPSPQTLTEASARAQGLADADQGFRQFVGEFGAKRTAPAGGRELVQARTYKDAQKVANRLEAESGRKWRPVRLNPWMGKREQLQALLDQTAEQDPFQVAQHPVHEAIHDALTATDGNGPWGIIPDAVAERMQQHLRTLNPGGGAKVLQVVNQAFRQAVLPLSVKWLTGNVVEAALRTGIMRAGPRSYVTGRRTLAELKRTDPHAYEQTVSRATRGGHYSFAERQHMHRGAEQFQNAGPVLRNLARAMGAFWRTPGPKQTAGAWRWFTHHVFETVNGNLERQFQTAMAGRHIRDEVMPDWAIKTGQKAIQEAAKGLRGTDAQVQLGRAVDRAYGKYSKFSPSQRMIISTYTPFVPWFLNAVNFVYNVLPRDHPVLTGLLASSYQASEEWRKQHGLDLFASGRVPGFLQGSVPAKGGGKLRIGRYVPFGAFGDLPGTIEQQVLPQYSSALNALGGRDWKGDPVRINGKPPDDIQKFQLAVKNFLEATVPVAPQASRVATGEGPLGGRLRKEFDPFRAIPPPKKKGGGSFDFSTAQPSSVKGFDFSTAKPAGGP